MAKKQKSVTTTKEKAVDVQVSKEEKKNTSLPKKNAYKAENTAPATMVFTKKNYILLGISIVIILLGFILMSADKDTYGFLALSIAPIVILAGFGFVFYAILYKDKTTEKGENA
jgi:hypothetical protein